MSKKADSQSSIEDLDKKIRNLWADFLPKLSKPTSIKHRLGDKVSEKGQNKFIFRRKVKGTKKRNKNGAKRIETVAPSMNHQQY